MACGSPDLHTGLIWGTFLQELVLCRNEMIVPWTFRVEGNVSGGCRPTELRERGKGAGFETKPRLQARLSHLPARFQEPVLKWCRDQVTCKRHEETACDRQVKDTIILGKKGACEARA